MTADALDDCYDAQLSRYALALAAGHVEPVLPELAAGSDAADVQRYVDNAVGERVRMLIEDAQLVGLVVDELPAHAAKYVQEVPRGAYEFGRRETPQFLEWLRNVIPLDAQQADFVAYQLAEFACLELAHQRREEYRQFTAAWTQRAAAPPERERDHAPLLQINPIRVWRTLSVISADEAAPEPRPTLFFACREQIQHATFDPQQASYLRSLEALAPCTLETWAQDCGLSVVAAASLANTWIAQGIVAAAKKIRVATGEEFRWNQ